MQHIHWVAWWTGAVAAAVASIACMCASRSCTFNSSCYVMHEAPTTLPCGGICGSMTTGSCLSVSRVLCTPADCKKTSPATSATRNAEASHEMQQPVHGPARCALGKGACASQPRLELPSAMNPKPYTIASTRSQVTPNMKQQGSTTVSSAGGPSQE